MRAFSKSLAWGEDGSGKRCVIYNDVVIVYVATRCLIVNAKTRFLDISFVCIHAPLTSSTNCSPDDFWKEHIPLVRKRAEARTVVSFLDANTAVAATIDGRIGDVLSGRKTVQGY